MTEATNWRDVKAKASAADPTWDSAERVARRRQMREQMLASVSGAQLAEIRQQRGHGQKAPSQLKGSAEAGAVEAVDQTRLAGVFLAELLHALRNCRAGCSTCTSRT
ncbi:hypothetical protein [Virgisporangium aurantiacum]|uniref:Uncharacterized protein n=1 Tax=Virgisporangium aurantiacum TaxID=175570 RepID=A0A8J3ZE66_9ACTN|nr:hypothetical protein [Virgisporangium aurantiacum]GIJ60035.1 hypothetical protein Vau01_075510 [Virgisporangium aurantiacum]